MTILNSLVEVDVLAALLAEDDVIVVDCRFYLEDTEAGAQAYAVGHIPTAQYAHLDRDLSGPIHAGSGRHPLPSEDSMAELFGRLGIAEGRQVVAYDDANGAAAARLWWMLRYMGHDRVAVLNGGLPAWAAAGMPVVSGVEEAEAVEFIGQGRSELLVEMTEAQSFGLLVDSRSAERYRGETEPIDPVAGHIPSAVNFFHRAAVDGDGRFLPPVVLRREFERLLGDLPAEETVFYCGSGVTACNNLLALVYAVLGDGRLYAGSWSEWCAVPGNRVALG